MRNDMILCGYMEKIKIHDLSMTNQVVNVKGKLEACEQ